MKTDASLIAVLLLVFLLTSCNVSEKLPGEAETALFNAIMRPSGVFSEIEYEIVSVNEARNLEAFAFDITPDEAWCVVVDPPVPNVAYSGKLASSDRIVVTRKDQAWEAFIMAVVGTNRDVWSQTGCDNWDDGF